MQEKKELIERLKKTLENKIVSLIIEGLKNGSITTLRSSEIAKATLKTLPSAKSLEELYSGIIQLSERFPELQRLAIEFIKAYEAEEKERVINLSSLLIKQNKYDLAEDFIKQFLKYKTSND